MPRIEERSTSDWLRFLPALPGVPGHEEPAALEIGKAFRLFADRVERDRAGNVLGWIEGKGDAPRPRALVAAHMDRIGFLVRAIEAGGFLRITEVGGFDLRTLLGKEVTIHSNPPIPALFATKPPHLQKRGESERVPAIEDLYLDTGRPEAEVRRRVPIGTPVTFRQPPVDLVSGRVAAPGMDDRAGIAVLVGILESLRSERPFWDVVAAATVEEEFGVLCRGARNASEALDPQLGIAIDVTHGDMPGAREGDAFPLGGGPSLTVGANIHPMLFEGLRRSARQLSLPFAVEAWVDSATDAMDIQIARQGIPTAVVGIPCRYMHTGVEMVDPKDVDRTARMIAHFLATLPADWRAAEVLK
jgi:tetrahedral aminopeptidase